MKQVLISCVLKKYRQDPPSYLPVILGRLLLCFILLLLISLQLITGSAIFFKPYDAIVPATSSTSRQRISSRFYSHNKIRLHYSPLSIDALEAQMIECLPTDDG